MLILGWSLCPFELVTRNPFSRRSLSLSQPQHVTASCNIWCVYPSQLATDTAVWPILSTKLSAERTACPSAKCIIAACIHASGERRWWCCFSHCLAAFLQQLRLTAFTLQILDTLLAFQSTKCGIWGSLADHQVLEYCIIKFRNTTSQGWHWRGHKLVLRRHVHLQ